MTTHLDEELLAQWAWDGDDPDAAAADHLRRCERCRTSLAELREVREGVHDLPRLEAPPADVWRGIVQELGLDTAERGSGPTGAAAARSGAVRRFRPRTLALAAAIAAVVGAGVGIGASRLITDEPEPAAQTVIKLEPLNGKSGTGSADLVEASSGGRLKVSATGLSSGQGFYEVWLINTDGKRMVSLGVLDPRSGGTFQLPANVTAQGYRIVDISLEPDDGNPEHSHVSVIRGTLPS